MSAILPLTAKHIGRKGDAADFRLLGPHLSTRFEVRRLARPRLLWLNERWWLAAGFDIFDAHARAELERLLMDEFAVGVPTPSDPPEHFDARAWLGADSYGEAGSPTHGGSGRSGHSAFFNAKGIGPAAPVAGDPDWNHSHGSLSLEEAVREAVCSEIASAEFPHGAVPVVALIDAGLRHHNEDGTPGARRAIVVRPNFVRLAHMLRTACFEPTGPMGPDKSLDALRTRDVVGAVWGDKADRVGLAISASDPFRAMERLGRQIGFSHAARLWPGPFAASNYTVDGALADFGSFQALPDWRRASAAPGQHAFGDEFRTVADSIRALAGSLRKHTIAAPDSEVLIQHFRSAVSTAFRSSLRSALHYFALGADAGLCREALAWCAEEFERQQRSAYVLGDEPSTASLYDRLIADHSHNPLARLLFQDLCANRKPAAESVLRRLLDLRRGLDRESLVASASALSESRGYGDADYPAMVTAMIERKVAAARRHWPMLPDRHLPLRHLSRGYCALIECLDSRTMKRSLWASGTNMGDEIAFFGNRLPQARLTGVVETGSTSIFPILPDLDRPIREVQVAGKTIALPGRWTSIC
jgi:hypothetical protein